MRLFESFMRNGEYVIFLMYFAIIFIYFYFVGGDLQFLCVICIYWINIVHIFFCILESFFYSFARAAESAHGRWWAGGCGRRRPL